MCRVLIIKCTILLGTVIRKCYRDRIILTWYDVSKGLALTDSDYSDLSDLFSDIRIYQTDISVRIGQKTIF